MEVDREFMYTGSAGPARANRRTDGRKAGRKGGRTGGRGVLKRKHLFFTAKMKKAFVMRYVFRLYKSRESASTVCYCSKYNFEHDRRSCRSRQSDPKEMEHKLRLATHQQRAGDQNDVSLTKLHQMKASQNEVTYHRHPTPSSAPNLHCP